VTLTGSEPAGAAVAGAAGEALKPSVLELGGSDPVIVMPSADFDAAVEACVGARIINNGQSCIAAKRFFAHSDIYERFRDAFVARFEALTVGDPMDRAHAVGPLATAQVREDLDGQVEASVAAGAKRLTGAHPIEGAGFYYRPGVLEAPPPDSPASVDELFGPVATLERIADLDDAIARANNVRFGLGSAIWTTEEAEIEAAVNGLEAGATFVNAIVASDPRLPFGGVKASGYGRELARDGARAFVNRKTVSVA
jgi:succinate-semialdehyde dehydrogenase/glutarate-semialdehyde dehydrogenase